MCKSLSYLYLFVALTTSSLATELIFFRPGPCDLTRDHMQCGNASPEQCCIGGSPWCGSLSCVGCVQGNDLYSYGRASCSRGALHTCREPASGASCCIGLGGGNTCAGNYFPGGAQAESVPMSQVEGAAPEAGCEKLVEPNKLVFTDDEGVRHAIHMPAGTFKTANEHYIAENYDELKKFPAWGECSKQEQFLTLTCLFPNALLSKLTFDAQLIRDTTRKRKNNRV